MTQTAPPERQQKSAAAPRFSDHLHNLNRAQKSGVGVPAYTRWVNRRLARGVAAGAAVIGLGPNGVTVISGAVSLVALIFLIVLPPAVGTGLLVAALLALGYVLDSADGQVARLTGRAGPTGEWLDHVVDAFRTPAIHLACAVATFVHYSDNLVLMAGAMGYALLSSGQFMSQILAEQLVGREPARTGGKVTRPQEQESSGLTKSFVLLPNDMGMVCWCFALWGVTPAFTVAYLVLFALNGAHSMISMRRKYVRLQQVTALAHGDAGNARNEGGA
ncbi:CDP-alcohol phosphatidyltransferase family protein [Demetria terragena]|uniref:CDP-alcohol phosphatidyltransferase family protein n=1 Tax=Demetria terragena TaxID=63959 RepID=UPI0003824DC9|nr:CDP-alcohol phosphatidyltransferase family protein [Demetria terragena]